MNQPTGQRIRRGMNFLSMLGAKLRDLQGTATLAHELIQNAEDAVGRITNLQGNSATMVFRLDEKALIVENQGVFSDCGDPHRQPCEWSPPCDFHGFTDVGSGRKRLEEKQKGAFGFGFTAVYQITDHPEVISSGRHWILEDEKPEDERIFQCPGCEQCQSGELPGTRFILPWAFDHDSSVRQALKVATVTEHGPEQFLKELLADLPHALLFLDHVRTIQVFWKNQLRLDVTRTHDPNCGSAVTILQNGQPTKWILLAADFEQKAATLRATHPPGEKKPISTVKIAVPEDVTATGLFFAFLPTQQPTGFPFHINADFFPATDRKRILLESDYQAEWNREAIRTAAIALKHGLLELRSFLGPKGFWQLLDRVHHLSTAGAFELNPLCKDYWKELVPTLQSEAVVPTADGKWLKAASVRHYREKWDDDTAGLFHALGIHTVDPSLSDFSSLLTSKSVGIRSCDAEVFASAAKSIGLVGTKQVSQMPAWFQALDHWDVLWSRIKPYAQVERKTENGKVWERLGSEWKLRGQATIQHAVLNPLAQCSLVKCKDGVFRNCSTVYLVDPETRTLFAALGSSSDYADDNPHLSEALKDLCKPFTWDIALSAIEGSTSDTLWQHRDSLLKWLSCRIDKLIGNSKLISQIRSLPICPTTAGLRPFSSVVLPGGFTDPIGVTDLIDDRSLSGIVPLLTCLEIGRLSLHDFITERLPAAFASKMIAAESCKNLLALLAEHQGEFLNDEGIRNELRSLPFIVCEDGILRASQDGLYFNTHLVREVLNDSVHYVAAENCTTAIHSFLTWLGVAAEPDIDRVATYAIAIAASQKTPSSGAVDKVQTLFEHLGNRLNEIRQDAEALGRLRQATWMPAANREWCTESRKWIQGKSLTWLKPQDAHLIRRHYLVESVASFIAFPTRLQDRHREFLEALCVNDTPKALHVVQHLTKAAKLGASIDQRLYQFLDRQLDEGGLNEKQLWDLKDVACLYDNERQACVRPSHCFSEKHPFGGYRVHLTADTLSTFTNLLSALAVRPEPDWNDAVDVLSEIAESDTVRDNLPVTDSDRQVVLACWRMIDAALRRDDHDRSTIEESLARIAGKRVVCRSDNLLSEPDKVFFLDREHLADAFAELLGCGLIPIPQRAFESLTVAGVRKLSDVTKTEIVFDNLRSQAHQEVGSRIRERSPLLLGVLESCRANLDDSDAALDKLEVCETATLIVQHTFNGFTKPIPSKRHEVLAIFDDKVKQLFYCREDGNVPWDAIACEIARFFLGTGDVPQLSAQISAVLEPSTLHKARRKLSQLGFPNIELAEDNPVAESETNSFGLGEVRPISGSGVESITAEQNHSVLTTSNSVPPENTNRIVDNKQGLLSAANLGRVITSRGPTDSGCSTDTPQSREGQGDRLSAENENVTESRVTGSEGVDYGGRESSYDDDDVPFIEELANRSGGTARRRDKVTSESDVADRRHSEQVLRQQRVNRIPKGEVEHYLRSYYSRDEGLYCQMRHSDEPDLHRMPFKKKNGEECWVRIELLNGKWANDLSYTLPEYKCLFILLCPNCAALYTEYVRNHDSQQDRLFEWFATIGNETGFHVKCSLGGRQPDRVLHFDPKHLDDIRAVRGITATST